MDLFFSKLFRLDRTDPLSFGPKFPEILVEWIAPVSGVGRKWKRSDSSDSDSVALMTPLTTPSFDFHQIISALATPLTTPTPTPSLVKTSLKKAMECKKPHSVLVMNETARASTMILTLSSYPFQLSAAAQTKR